MEQTAERRKLNEHVIDAVKQAKTLQFDGVPASNTIIVNDKALAEILGCTTQTIYNWRQTGVLVKFKRQGSRVTIYKLKDVIQDLERFIK